MLHRQVFDSCPQCWGKEEVKIGDAPQLRRMSQIERQGKYDQRVDSYWYEDYTCPKGHRTIGVYQNMQYEFLLDMALEDLLDSNFRGAYFNFASAEERFYEFVIKLIIKDSGVSLKEFNNAWKNLKQTERQYGAYCMLYLAKVGKAPQNKNNVKINKGIDIVKVRNDVIHNGYKPTEQETKFYGNFILKLIFDTLGELHSVLKEDTVGLVVSDKLNSDIAKLKNMKIDLDSVNVVTIGGGGIASQLFVANPIYKTVDELLKEMDSYRNKFKYHYALK